MRAGAGCGVLVPPAPVPLCPGERGSSAPRPGKGRPRSSVPRQAAAPRSGFPDENPVSAGPVGEESPELRVPRLPLCMSEPGNGSVITHFYLIVTPLSH